MGVVGGLAAAGAVFTNELLAGLFDVWVILYFPLRTVFLPLLCIVQIYRCLRHSRGGPRSLLGLAGAGLALCGLGYSWFGWFYDGMPFFDLWQRRSENASDV